MISTYSTLDRGSTNFRIRRNAIIAAMYTGVSFCDSGLDLLVPWYLVVAFASNCKNALANARFRHTETREGAQNPETKLKVCSPAERLHPGLPHAPPLSVL